MSLIQAFRSSFDDVWTSYISGPAADALIKNIPRSSFATSRTINFCRAMTGGFWSLRTTKEEEWSGTDNSDCWIFVSIRSMQWACMITTVANVYFWSFSCRKMSESVRRSASTSEEVHENMLNGKITHQSDQKKKALVSPLSRPVAVFHRSRPWCFSVCPRPIMSCLRKVCPFFSLATLRFSMRLHTSCNLWWRSYSLTLRSTAVITSRIWASTLERSACSSVSSVGQHRGNTLRMAFSRHILHNVLLWSLQPVEGSRSQTLCVLQYSLQKNWVLCNPLGYQQNALWDLSPLHQRVVDLLLERQHQKEATSALNTDTQWLSSVRQISHTRAHII